VVSRRGDEHEARYLARLVDQGLTVVEIDSDVSSLAALEAAEAATLAAMRAGVDVVYQATFFDGRWRGHADFLLRVERPSLLGPYGYEVADTKLARHVKASALLQMCAYSEQLARLQGVEPELMHVVLGDMSTHGFRVLDYAAYHRAAKRRLEEAVLGAPEATYPDPVEHCGLCRWAEPCDRRRRQDDHLSFVAGMRRDQTRKLVRSDIATVAALGESAPGERVGGIGQPTLERLRDQARVQVDQRQSGDLRYELLEPEPGRGLGALPAPSAGDLFFDMEGDPFAEEQGLEYLFGVVEVIGGVPVFEALWAHSRADEKRAFEGLIDLVMDRLARDPELHVYHYAHYEPTALKRLMGLHATREDEVDQLLRAGVLVDLYQVVRQGLRTGQESYSIKALEPFYMEARQGEIADAGSSIVAYERWLELSDPAILDAIAEYNRDDCVSTWRLRDWLEGLRAQAAAHFGVVLERPDLIGDELSEEQLQQATGTAALVEALTAHA